MWCGGYFNKFRTVWNDFQWSGTDSTAIVCQAVQGGIGTIGTVLTPLTGQDFPDMPCAQVGSTWDEIQNNAENLKANADAIGKYLINTSYSLDLCCTDLINLFVSLHSACRRWSTWSQLQRNEISLDGVVEARSIEAVLTIFTLFKVLKVE